MAKVGVSITAATATTLQLALTNVAADGLIELQVSPRVDFVACVCPIGSIPRAASYLLKGLNQRGTFYVRARDRRADGSTEGWGPITAGRTSQGTAWP